MAQQIQDIVPINPSGGERPRQTIMNDQYIRGGNHRRRSGNSGNGGITFTHGQYDEKTNLDQ
jgi:hypothetical protein